MHFKSGWGILKYTTTQLLWHSSRGKVPVITKIKVWPDKWEIDENILKLNSERKQ